MDDFRIAVKSFIVNGEGEMLLVKRRVNDVHCKGAWELPGGRLDPGENPFDGLKRETKEETGLDIEVLNPIRVQHFTREDGQKITMLIFLCRPIGGSVELSNEHTEHTWIAPEKAIPLIHHAFHKDIETFNIYFKDKILEKK